MQPASWGRRSTPTACCGASRCWQRRAPRKGSQPCRRLGSRLQITWRWFATTLSSTPESAGGRFPRGAPRRGARRAVLEVTADRTSHGEVVLVHLVSCVIWLLLAEVPPDAIASKMAKRGSQVHLRGEPVEIAWKQPGLPDIRHVHQPRHPALQTERTATMRGHTMRERLQIAGERCRGEPTRG
jgi:hypothetical protein